MNPRNFPFRRALAIDPIIIPVGSSPLAVAINQDAIKAQGVTSFKMFNPTDVWVWYRGWNGTQAPIPPVKEMGHYIAPGMVDLNTSQIPQWIAAEPQAEPGRPLPSSFTGYRLIMLYGSGA